MSTRKNKYPKTEEKPVSGPSRRVRIPENKIKISKMTQGSSSGEPTKKRKARDNGADDESNEKPDSKSTTKKKKTEILEEKRLKRYRAKAPSSYLERLSRVKSQRMFLIDRHKITSVDGVDEKEVFDIAGTTGNIYQVTISRIPTCSCPDYLNGNQCKHIIYVLVNILKAREDLSFQLAFLTEELAEMFANAPETPQSYDGAHDATDTGGRRKPIEGDCPVCVMEFEESDRSEDIIWCKAACGNNIHRHCFEQWARSKPGAPKCVYCRTVWKGDEDSLKRIAKGAGKVGAEGYINVASELGLSAERDMSSYHQHWVDREFGRRQYGGYGYDQY